MKKQKSPIFFFKFIEDIEKSFEYTKHNLSLLEELVCLLVPFSYL